ncbi:MAG: DUF4403 family protein [Xanthomonadales bacterium]|nr:DUF4403 family protein [Xanthomonadales bacterium]
MAVRSARRWLLAASGLLALALLALSLRTHLPGPGETPVEAPPRLGMTLPQTPVPDSLLLLPIELQAAALAEIADQLPEHIPIPPRRERKKFRFGSVSIHTEGDVWLSSTTVRAHDGALWVSTNADAELRAELAGRRKTVRGRAAIDARITLQVGADWTVKPDIELDYRWLQAPSTRVFGIDVGLRRQADRALQPRLDQLEQRWAESIQKKLDLRARAEQWWMRLQQPIVLSSEPPLWLQVDPASVYWQPPRTDDESLQLLLGVRAKLQLVHGPVPDAREATALPALSLQAPEDSQLRLNLDVQAQYAAMTEALQAALGGKSRTVSYAGGSAIVQFEEFRVYPSAPDLVLAARLRIEGLGLRDSKGWVYLHGRPGFDPKTRTLSITNIDFVSVSDNPLLQAASELLRDQIRAQLAAAARIDLSDRLTQVQETAQTQLNQWVERAVRDRDNASGQAEKLAKHLHLAASIDDLQLLDLAPGDDALMLRVSLSGKLALELR